LPQDLHLIKKVLKTISKTRISAQGGVAERLKMLTY
jgi:hypothetical protein